MWEGREATGVVGEWRGGRHTNANHIIYMSFII